MRYQARIAGVSRGHGSVPMGILGASHALAGKGDTQSGDRGEKESRERRMDGRLSVRGGPDQFLLGRECERTHTLTHANVIVNERGWDARHRGCFRSFRQRAKVPWWGRGDAYLIFESGLWTRWRRHVRSATRRGCASASCQCASGLFSVKNSRRRTCSRVGLLPYVDYRADAFPYRFRKHRKPYRENFIVRITLGLCNQETD